MKKTPLLACALLAASFSLNAETKLPNILILYADDMGYGDLAIQNEGSKIPTPYLDKLAEQGMRFTDGHSSSGICTPSRYALLTGRYHWRDFHGIVRSFGESVFDEAQLTLPEMLQDSGYSTAIIGKWHLGWNWEALRKKNAGPKVIEERTGNVLVQHTDYDWSKSIPDGPLAHGFDYYFGDNVINFPPYTWIENDKVLSAPNRQMSIDLWKPAKEGKWEAREGPMIEGWDPYEVLPEITRRAVSYIEGRKGEDKPFFLHFSFPSPHAPIVPTEEFEGTSKAGPYGDFVVQTDWSSGQLLAALERTGLDENTIVIFTADNGAEHYAYPRALKYDHWSSEPFRGLKRDIYEGGHHVPFLVKWPGVIEPGSVSNALISQIDLMATLAAVTNSDIPSGQAADSYNQLPVFQNGAREVRQELVHNTKADAYAVRNGNWLLIAAPSGEHNRKDRSDEFEAKRGYEPDDDEPYELYNLDEDPGQFVNLAKQNPAMVKSLLRQLQAIRQSE